MAFGKKFDKNKLKLKEKRKQQNPLFKRKKFCRFTAAHVEQVDYKDPEHSRTRSRWPSPSPQHQRPEHPQPRRCPQRRGPALLR